MTHTPTPWHVTNGDAVTTNIRTVFISPRTSNPEEREISKGNAQFAVRAVNSHDELIAALERLAS